MKEKNIKLAALRKEILFQIPQGYFEKLSNKIQTEINKNQVEPLNHDLPLADYRVLDLLEKESFFQIPQGYFEQLPGRISARLISRNSPEKLDFSEMMNFSLSLQKTSFFISPAGYFENLPARISARLEKSVLSELDFSALEEGELGILKNLEKKNPFQVPEGYFEKLSQSLENKAFTDKPKTRQPAKTVKFTPAWLRPAASLAAAVLVAAVGFGVYQYQKPAETICTSLLCDVSDTELMDYLHENGISPEVMMDVEKEHSLNDQILPKPAAVPDEELLNELDINDLENLN
jgi:hypothetical protein